MKDVRTSEPRPPGTCLVCWKPNLPNRTHCSDACFKITVEREHQRSNEAQPDLAQARLLLRRAFDCEHAEDMGNYIDLALLKLRRESARVPEVGELDWVQPLIVEVKALRKVAEAARALVDTWDWPRLLSDSPDASEILEQVTCVEAALSPLDARPCAECGGTGETEEDAAGALGYVVKRACPRGCAPPCARAPEQEVPYMCRVVSTSSRVCSLGTKSCEVFDHAAVPSSGGAKHTDRTLSEAHQAGIEVGRTEERAACIEMIRHRAEYLRGAGYINSHVECVRNVAHWLEQVPPRPTQAVRK